jgi:hypothetical protein
MPVPQATLDWLKEPDNPAVATLTRRRLLEEPASPELDALWARRNEYAPVAAILDAQREDGSWDTPGRDYQKYGGSLWQVHLLGELWADPSDERVQRAAEYAFSRQLDDGSWSASNAKPAGSITCLTANVGRALARLGHADDERVVAALRYCADLRRELGCVDCRPASGEQLNGYCHMLTPKILLFLAEVPRGLWPDGSEELRDECVERLRDKSVFRCLPEEYREFGDAFWSLPAGERKGFAERFRTEHPPDSLHYKDKAGWLRFGFPLSYNSDALEALAALMAIGEEPRAEYRDAIALVRDSADEQMRWTLRNTFNGKMIADIEEKGAPSKWLTLRALQVLDWAGVP